MKKDTKSITDEQQNQNNSSVSVTLSYSSKRIEPTSIVLFISVSHPSTVWCNALLPGTIFEVSTVMKGPHSFIRGSLSSTADIQRVVLSCSVLFIQPQSTASAVLESLNTARWRSPPYRR